MYCQKCGTEIGYNFKFCPKCGSDQDIERNRLIAASEGDQEAIKELYNLNYNEVFTLVRGMVKSEEKAFDIVQDAYIKGFESLNQIKNPKSYKAWIKTIARNKAIDYLRKQQRQIVETVSIDDDNNDIQIKDESMVPDLVIEKGEQAKLLKEMLDELSDEQRLAVILYYVEKMSVSEIASQFGCSERTIRSRIKYGRDNLGKKAEQMEKRGISLYGFVPVIFFAALFKNGGITVQAAEKEEMLSGILSSKKALSAESMAQSGTAAQASTVAQTGAAAQAGIAAQASTAAQTGAATQAGIAAQTGTAAQASTVAQAGKAVKITKVAAVAGAKTTGKALAIKVATAAAVVVVGAGTAIGVVHEKNKDNNQQVVAEIDESKIDEQLPSQADKNEENEQVQSQTDKSETVEEKTTEAKNKYNDDLKMYKNILDKYYEDISNDNIRDYVGSQYWGSMSDLKTFGYAFKDINSDGVDELFMNSVEKSDPADNFYRMYTIVDGEPVSIVGTDTRRWPSLCKDGYINVNESSSRTILYKLENGKLVKVDENNIPYSTLYPLEEHLNYTPFSDYK